MIPANIIYGIFWTGNYRSSDSRYRSGCWSWYLGCHQPVGRLRQRQPWRQCSCTVEKHKTWIASPAAIPKSGERNRKIHSCVLYLISIWTYQADTAISLLAVNARLPIVRRKQEYRKGIKISNFFVTKFRFLRLTYEAEGGDDKYGLWKAL